MASTLESLSSSVAGRLSGLTNADQLDDDFRNKLAQDLTALLLQVRTPMMALRGLATGPHAMTMTKVASGMGVFDAFAANGNNPMTVDELHKHTKGDKALLLRTLRIIAAHGLFKQVSKEEWQPTAFGSSFTTDSLESHLLQHLYEHMKTQAVMDEYLRTKGYQNPDDAFDGPWQYAYNTDKNYFGWLEDNDTAQKSFNAVMTIQQQFRGANWFTYFPVQQKLNTQPPTSSSTSSIPSAASNNQDRPLLVDVGGGVGHDAIAFRQEYPGLPGKVVLQDLPRVIDTIRHPLPDGIEAQGHDIFAPQPVQGARAYCLRRVLHDWPDKQAVQILRRVRDACADDSLLLINEGVVPEEYVSSESARYDVVMMTTCSSEERTVPQWARLFHDAGFELVKVWKPDDFAIGSTALFEAIPI